MLNYAMLRVRRRALHFVNDLWALVSTAPFYKVEMTGEWNLPDPKTPAVYVCNHQSYLDIYTLFR
jgi:1-acyl-sn-glycerol-3-phosphate acyltransferase